MSEGRTPTATLTSQRQLAQADLDILNQIVRRAQRNPVAEVRPKDALLQAYKEIFDEQQLSQQHDRSCFSVLLKLLNPATPGASLCDKLDHILQQEGIELTFEDDATSQGDLVDDARHSDDITRDAETLDEDSTRGGYYPTESVQDQIKAIDNEYSDNLPSYFTYLLQQAEVRDRAVLAKQTIDAWRRAHTKARNKRLHEEERADAVYHLHLKQKVIKQCIAVFQEHRYSQVQADRVYDMRLARNVLGKTSDEYRIRRVNWIDENRIKGSALYNLVVESRVKQFVGSRERQLKTTTLHMLIQSYRTSKEKEAQLEELLRLNTNRRKIPILESALSMLTRKVQTIRDNEAHADNCVRTALCSASVNVWRSKTNDVLNLVLDADDARGFFLVKWAFHRWRESIRTRKHARYDDAYRQIRRMIKMNLVRRLLYSWRQSVRDRADNDIQADATYRAALCRRIIRPAVDTIYDVAEWTKANNIRAGEVANEFLQRRALIAWQVRHQALLDMDDKADRLTQYRTEQRAVQALRQMQLRAFELQRRQSDADAFRGRGDKRAIRNVLARMRRVLAERRAGSREGELDLGPTSAITPARKREELLMSTATRFSTTPAYTPFATPFTKRLRDGPRVLDDIDDADEGDEAQNVVINSDDQG